MDTLLTIHRKYGFLLSQLIKRDFKTKYRRSFLGILWSLLNPLLLTIVQYMVFSALFRFDIENYAVYLLSGIVMFNYLTEASTQSMVSIIQNASLINKVSIPKYIYPLSRVLSTSVNFLLSLAALYIVIIGSGLNITLAHLSIIFVLCCLFLFVLGISFILSSLMVFFRDTQFLYSVFLTLWTYLTPIFYPESILPKYMDIFLELNPMYHFIRFFRFIVLYNGIPDPMAWVYCFIFAFGVLIIGVWIFKRQQNNFIQHL